MSLLLEHKGERAGTAALRSRVPRATMAIVHGAMRLVVIRARVTGHAAAKARMAPGARTDVTVVMLRLQTSPSVGCRASCSFSEVAAMVATVATGATAAKA